MKFGGIETLKSSKLNLRKPVSTSRHEQHLQGCGISVHNTQEQAIRRVWVGVSDDTPIS